jgi:hypothetical protein
LPPETTVVDKFDKNSHKKHKQSIPDRFAKSPKIKGLQAH